MNENETSLYPVVEPSAFPITNRNQLESTMLRMQEDPPATTAQTMPTDVDVLELDGEFDYEGYQVVRREFFAHTYEPSVTFNNYKFYVNAACLNRFPTVDFVQVLVNQERKILAIRPCEEGDRDAFAWATNSRGRRRARQVSCRLFFAKVFSLMGWNLDNRYKLLGRIIHANDEYGMQIQRIISSPVVVLIASVIPAIPFPLQPLHADVRGQLADLFQHGFPYLLAPAFHSGLVHVESFEQYVLFGIHDGQSVFQTLGCVPGGIYMDVHPAAAVDNCSGMAQRPHNLLQLSHLLIA